MPLHCNKSLSRENGKDRKSSILLRALVSIWEGIGGGVASTRVVPYPSTTTPTPISYATGDWRLTKYVDLLIIASIRIRMNAYCIYSGDAGEDICVTVQGWGACDQEAKYGAGACICIIYHYHQR